MPWTMLDDGFPDHPKLINLTMEQGYLWVLGINYCNRYLTDGQIPAGALASLHPATPLAKKKRMAAELVAVGLWDETPGGWAIHDFHEYQLTAEEVKARRAKRAEAGRKGGRRSAEKRQATAQARAQAHAQASASDSVEHVLDESLPDRDEANGNPIPSLPPKELSSTGTPRAATPPADDDPRVPQTLAVLAERDSDRGTDIRDPHAYFARCHQQRIDRDHDAIAALALAHPHAGPDELAERFEPTPPIGAWTPPPPPDGALTDQRGTFLPGTGWIPNGDGGDGHPSSLEVEADPSVVGS